MADEHDWVSEVSPFHAGERDLQARAGRAEKIDFVGRRFIRPFMPEEHRTFFKALPVIAAGAVDPQGRPWASLLFGEPGFVHPVTPTRLRLTPDALAGDPVLAALQPGAGLGLLGLEWATKRRNRVNGRIGAVSDGQLELAVQQSFGNCPRYIPPLSLHRTGQASPTGAASRSSELDAADRALIGAAQRFFVASFAAHGNHETASVDVSHRGGPAGFVAIHGQSLTVPDYAGNNFFNTLGNFLSNPLAGLVFADFQTGDLLWLTGRVRLDWADEAWGRSPTGPQRAWHFETEARIRIPGAMPIRLA